MRELAEDGYSGVEVRVTPTRTEIIILATRTQNVLGEKGRRIRELTAVVQKRFNFPEGSVEVGHTGLVLHEANHGLKGSAFFMYFHCTALRRKGCPSWTLRHCSVRVSPLQASWRSCRPQVRH